MTIIYRNGIAGKICANPDCGWRPISEFHPRRLLGLLVGDGFKSRCKECSKAQARAERAKKLEQYRARERKYVESKKDHYRDLKPSHQKANPEHYKEALHKYRETHREVINHKARERRQQQLEHYREIGKKSREKHATERNAYQRRYGKENRDKLTLYTNNRRVRKLEAEGSHNDIEWQDLKAFYDFKCLCCGKREPEIKLTRAHVIPLTQGGTDRIDNIQPLCARCNSKKNDKHIDYR
jgi:5-methylcytosine-specific restriction endonuclease McrA